MAKRPGPGPDDLDADLLEPGAPDPGEGCGAASVAPPLTDELDLHAFRPRDCADVVAEYLEAAQDAGLLRVRIVHGKGTGALRAAVRETLARHPLVHEQSPASAAEGGDGATIVRL